MAERRPFLLRIDKDVLDAVQRWADDDLRSLNAQIEFLLRRALQDAGRSPQSTTSRLLTIDALRSSSRRTISRWDSMSRAICTMPTAPSTIR